jgi:rod shape-determining protein MreD
MIVGFLNGYLRKIFFPEDWKLPFASIAISDLVKNLGIYLVMFLLRGRFDFLYYLLNIILPEIVYTLVVSIVIYPVFLKLNKKLEVGEKRRASKFV